MSLWYANPSQNSSVWTQWTLGRCNSGPCSILLSPPETRQHLAGHLRGDREKGGGSPGLSPTLNSGLTTLMHTSQATWLLLPLLRLVLHKCIIIVVLEKVPKDWREPGHTAVHNTTNYQQLQSPLRITCNSRIAAPSNTMTDGLIQDET